ncbi:hypothetical protein SAMN05216198_1143 [Halopseudomonas litoralis]|uniref:Chromosome segregation ATPase n=1 Tax=Halopseudomonas litoralis TaxID=797277 RepID=A0A1H1PBH2_9GAMM|nr:hypothetical protein [Halopseudomonas litoralis]SDS08601.1 hypothetical protein SAMN05216198_1143 [Halopseudomonas litoralis]
MDAREVVRIQKPLLTEAVMFFSEHGISREMLFPEFEALLDGLVAAPECADETIEAVFLQINHRLHVRAAVFITIDFDMEGYVNRLWNLPLRQLAEKASRGPDMGGGPIRLACLGFGDSQYRASMWKPRQRGGKADLALIKSAVTRNALGILGDDEEALAVLAGDLQVAAEDTWYGNNSTIDAGTQHTLESELAAEFEALKKTHAGEVAEYLRQISELHSRLSVQEQIHRQQLENLRAQHTDHQAVARGELLDIKQELAEQQKLNALLRRELSRLQHRTSVDTE